MNQVKVQILKTTVTAMYGTLLEGAQLRTSPEFAAHLVDECGAAKYAVDDAVGTAPDAAPVPVALAVDNDAAVKPDAPVQTSAQVPKRAARQARTSSK